MISESTTLRYHKELNPKLWENGDVLKHDVLVHLLDIANEWMEFANIKSTNVDDIIITGGNCNFNYTDVSDIDLHIIVDYAEINSDTKLLMDYYMSKKSLWGKNHPNISIYGYPVEVFAQDAKQPPHQDQGVYSIKNNKWIFEPKHLGLDLENDLGVEHSSAELAARINLTVSHDRGVELAQRLADKIYNMRGEGIRKSGEFSKGTLIFKDLRNRGLIDKLNKYISEHLDKRLSLG